MRLFVFASVLFVAAALVRAGVPRFALPDLLEAVSDVRDGRIDTTIGELYTRTRPRLPALIASATAMRAASSHPLVDCAFTSITLCTLILTPPRFVARRTAFCPPSVHPAPESESPLP